MLALSSSSLTTNGTQCSIRENSLSYSATDRSSWRKLRKSCSIFLLTLVGKWCARRSSLNLVQVIAAKSCWGVLDIQPPTVGLAIQKVSGEPNSVPLLHKGVSKQLLHMHQPLLDNPVVGVLAIKRPRAAPPELTEVLHKPIPLGSLGHHGECCPCRWSRTGSAAATSSRGAVAGAAREELGAGIAPSVRHPPRVLAVWDLGSPSKLPPAEVGGPPDASSALLPLSCLSLSLRRCRLLRQQISENRKLGSQVTDLTRSGSSGGLDLLGVCRIIRPGRLERVIGIVTTTHKSARALPVACPDPPYVYTYKASTIQAEASQYRTSEHRSRRLTPECRLVGSDPHKHVRMSTNGKQARSLKNPKLHQPNWAVFAQRDGSLPSRDRSLAANPKNQRSGTGLSLRGTGLSLRRRARDRSRPPGTGCLEAAATLLTGGPVSPFRDRSPRVKTLRTCPEFQFSNFLV
uniref:Uncharacterized protein n=1 Tax=Ananas comosus var. bracteatus TaxID=296719 RepID=A0A6V7NF65_ANACO|nr:unnamed protein product [Ananas comosus var. bracteatus]